MEVRRHGVESEGLVICVLASGLPLEQARVRSAAGYQRLLPRSYDLHGRRHGRKTHTYTHLSYLYGTSSVLYGRLL
jgi:hypothetical protein